MLARLMNVMCGETIALIEIPEQLVVETIDHGTMSLRSLRNGGMYTIVPLNNDEDTALINLLKEIKRHLDYLQHPSKPSLRAYYENADALIQTAAALFTAVEYTVIETKHELELLCNPAMARDYEFKKKSCPILGRYFKAFSGPNIGSGSESEEGDAARETESGQALNDDDAESI